MVEEVTLYACLVVLVGTLFSFSGCGRPPADGYGDAGGGHGGAPSAPASEGDALVARECGRCHDGRTHPARIGSVAQFKATGSRGRVANGSMPPDRRLAADVKAKLTAL